MIRSNKFKKKRSTEKLSAVGILKKTFIYGLYSSFIGGIIIVGYLVYLSHNLPTLNNLVDPNYDLPTQVYDRNGKLVTEFFTKRRVLIPIEKVPPVVKQALLSIEDSRFYDHFGIDPLRMLKALIIDVIKMEFAQGASTITQQTAKQFLLTSDKKLVRKLKEILLALKIERLFSKDKILELYLNKVYFGHGAYGIEAASLGYFNKTTSDLNLQEAALLVGIVQRPATWAPTASIKNATRRRNLVLNQMYTQGYIDAQQKITAMAAPIELKLNQKDDNNETSYYVEHIRKYLLDKYGINQLYRGGMKVYTNMDLDMQIYAQTALMEGLEEHDRRQGYRGASKNLLQEVNQELSMDVFDEEKGWKRDKFDLLEDELKHTANALFREKLNKVTEKNRFIIGGRVQGVVTKVNRKRAEISLGSYHGKLDLNAIPDKWARPVDYTKNLNWKTRLKDLNDILKFGDVINLKIKDYNNKSEEFLLALFQTPIANGSIFVMEPKTGEVLAMSGGYDFKKSEFNRATQSKRQPGSSFKPIVYSLALDNTYTAASILEDTPLVFKDTNWKPFNYSKTFKGKMPLRDALVHSKNIPTVRLTMSLGINSVIEHAQHLGLHSQFPEDLTIGLGTASVTLEDMVRTYGIFANGGNLVKPFYIRKVEDREGATLEEHIVNEEDRVLSEDTSFLMTSILSDVVQRGSGWRAKSLHRPTAGKTGTTNNYTDAWFIGYTPQLVTGVYVGFDDIRKTLGYNETGSRAAAPIWLNFMQQALEDRAIRPFQQPDDIQMVKINPKSGLLACDQDSKSNFEFFKPGTAPTQCHQGVEATLQNSAINYETSDETRDSNEEGDDLMEEL